MRHVVPVLLLIVGILALMWSSKSAWEGGYKACVSPSGNTWEHCRGR